MDPPPAVDSRRRAPGGGRKSRGCKQLGLKRSSAPAPTPGYSPAQAADPPPPPISDPAVPNPSSAAPNPSFAAPNLTPSAPTSSPAVTTSTSMPQQPPQGAGWGAIPPNFALHGNQQFPNSWLYPPGGFVNLTEQPHCLQQPQVQGENFHLVGQPMSFNSVSQSQPPSACRTPQQGNSTKEPVNIVIDEDDNSGANRSVQKRYWSHEEEERLASAWLNASKDPIHGNDKKTETFWNEITNDFNKKGNGKRRRESNQLKVHWSRLKSSITDFNDAWTKVTQMHTSGYSDDMLGISLVVVDIYLDESNYVKPKRCLPSPLVTECYWFSIQP